MILFILALVLVTGTRIKVVCAWVEGEARSEDRDKTLN